ncbi:protealysin inhibitor emfourin [Nonomuraea sp. NPDC048916]|uniref:protealysin inhibitor emfourin n=1 Tax=Nonomuraea sp. NPDC048916 TaxID=3154232 RepID=UPI0033DC1168
MDRRESPQAGARRRTAERRRGDDRGYDSTLRVRLRLSGGMPPLDRDIPVDAFHLPADRARELDTLVRALPAEDVRGLLPPPVPDSTFYELHVEWCGTRRAYWYHDGSLPPEARVLVQFLLDVANGEVR